MTDGAPGNPSALPPLPTRDPLGHKGTFGTVGVLGGSAQRPRIMVGGPAFAALGALRAGAGLAVIAAPQSLVPSILTVCPSAIGLALPEAADGSLLPSACAEILDDVRGGFAAFVIGPGLGLNVAAAQIVVRLCAVTERPLVIDADALSALASLDDFAADLRAPCVLTPHPGEFRRMADALGIDADAVDPAKRAQSAERLAQRLGCVVVLKGARTIVTDGHQTHESEIVCDALATAGTGDVLAGVIAGLIAQHHDPLDAQRGLSLHACAVHGVEVHGRAALRMGGPGILAAELAEEVGRGGREGRMTDRA